MCSKNFSSERVSDEPRLVNAAYTSLGTVTKTSQDFFE